MKQNVNFAKRNQFGPGQNVPVVSVFDGKTANFIMEIRKKRNQFFGE